MLSLPTAAQTHLQGDVISIAFCIQIQKANGSYLRLTSHNEDVIVGGNTYYSDSGADATAIKLVNNMAVGGGDLYTTIKSDRINELDIFSGQYNGAAYSIFFCNFLAPDDFSVIISTGILGEVKINGGEFSCELRSLAQRLNRIVGKYYQPGCRAELFDAECGKSPTAFSYSGAVTAVVSNESFIGTPNKPTNFFKYGRVLWLTGANAGMVSEVKSNNTADNKINLFISTGSPIAIGDTYTIREGCDKKFATCRDKFANQLNFRGEPHIPGIDKAFIARL